MPGYIERALQRFQHVSSAKPERAPHPRQRPNFAAKTQLASLPDVSPALNVADKTRILEVLGKILFYARAIDSTILTAIDELATKQSHATKTTMDKFAQLLNDCAAHPDATTRFTASNMILAVKSNASYLSGVKGRSRAARYFFLTNKPTSPTGPYKPYGAVHVLCHIIRKVLSSAAEAEVGALFHNGKGACPLRIALKEMGYPQPATPMATDNNTASGIATGTVKQVQSNRYAVLLDPRSCTPRPISSLLEQRPDQMRRLLLQTSSCLASSDHSVHVLVFPHKSYADLF